MRTGPQLIAYADRFGGSISGLHHLLAGPFAGLFDGVHVLPFYTPFDGADAGFDPADHTTVDPRLGDWSDLRSLAADYEVMADFIVNHMSAGSAEFRDVVANGEASEHFDLFLKMADVYPDGAREEELAGIYRPRPGTPFSVMTLGGRKRLVWTTFTPGQIDLNLAHPAGQAYLERVMTTLAEGGVRQIRLDAVGYAVKTAGTSSFMTPHTFAFIDRLTARCRELGMTVLVEVHSHFADQISVAGRVDRVYDFALPPLLLQALYTGDAGALRNWLEIRPRNTITVLDTHDGIGVIDVGQKWDGTPGLLESTDIAALVEGIHTSSGGSSRKATGWAASNVDVYQVNCTYYDALGGNDEHYLLARAVQLFTPGIPQIYYVGLLAAGNDLELLARTGVGRDINRHYFTADEIEAALRRPVVQRLLALIRLRRDHPAFGGDFTLAGGGNTLVLGWTSNDAYARLTADFAHGTFTVDHT